MDLLIDYKDFTTMDQFFRWYRVKYLLRNSWIYIVSWLKHRKVVDFRFSLET